jgi:hypothetical protein
MGMASAMPDIPKTPSPAHMIATKIPHAFLAPVIRIVSSSVCFSTPVAIRQPIRPGMPEKTRREHARSAELSRDAKLRKAGAFP